MRGVSIPSFIKIGALESTLKSGELKSREKERKKKKHFLSPISRFCTSHKISLETNFYTRFFATYSLRVGELNMKGKVSWGNGKHAKLTCENRLLLPGIYSNTQSALSPKC